MFTGIIQAIGKVREPEKLGNGVRLTIVTPEDFHLEEVRVGDSIAVNGACMTVVNIEGKSFQIDVSARVFPRPAGWILSVKSTLKRQCVWAIASTAIW